MPRATSDITKKLWFSHVTDEEMEGEEFSHLFLPPKYGVDGLHPGSRVSCEYGQDTPRRALWHALHGERQDAMTEIVPSCGEEDCIQPHHCVKIDRSAGQHGRTWGKTVKQILAELGTKVERSKSMKPPWAKVADPSAWSQIEEGLGQTVAHIICKIIRAVDDGKNLRSRISIEDMANVGGYYDVVGYCVDYAQLLQATQNADIAGLNQVVWQFNDIWESVVRDAFIRMPRTSWFVNYRQKHMIGKTLAEVIRRETGFAVITLVDRGNPDDWNALMFDLLSAEEMASARGEMGAMPEPE